MRYPGFELSVLTFLWSISLTEVVLAVDREGKPLDQSGVCDPELLSSPTNSLSVEKLLKRLQIDKAALVAYQLRTFAGTHPQAEKILSHIIKNIPP